MELLLFALVLVSLCRGHAFMTSDFCHGKPCPNMTMIQKYKDFEERFIGTSEWLTTKIKSTSDVDILAAHGTLMSVKGYVYAWPVLINVQNGNNLSLSWFVAPESNPQKTKFVTRETRPAATYYVSVFFSKPSIKKGLEEKEKLCQLITSKQCDDGTYSGAGYDPLMSPTHHSEIWIKKTE